MRVGRLFLALGLAVTITAPTLHAQGRAQVGAADAVSARLFVAFILEQANRKTSGIPCLFSDLAADLKLAIALGASDRELVDSRIGAFKTGLAIASAVIKRGDSVGAWLKSRASDASRPELARLEAENETLVNKAFSASSASAAVMTQGRVRAALGMDLAALEREFRSAVAAALSRDPTLGVLGRSETPSSELVASRARVRQLLVQAGAKP